MVNEKTRKDGKNYYVIAEYNDSYFLLKATPSDETNEYKPWQLEMINGYPKDGKFTIEDY